VKRLATAVTASTERREVRPVARFDGFFDSINGRYDHDQRARIECMLNLAFIGVGDANARHSLRCWASSPHASNGFPIARIMLHLRPDEIVSGIGHRAINS